MNCAGCRNNFKTVKGLQCLDCHEWYDLLCANIPEKKFRLMSKDKKASWQCLTCSSKLPKVDNTNTPARSGRSDSPITTSRSPSPIGTHNALRNKPLHVQPLTVNNNTLLTELTSGTLRELIRQEISTALQVTVREIVNKQVVEIKEIIAELQKSLTFFNSKYEELNVTVEEHNAKIHSLEKEKCALQNSLLEVTKRMNLFEQHARCQNIEIQCVPERNTENLMDTVTKLGKAIKCEVKDIDIQLCTRLAKKDPKNTRPRSILVKFNSPRTRDSFLAAAIQYNKSNPNNKLNSAHLNLALDNPSPIFVVEHLSAENKALHAATRKRAKELGYKFVWVRNGKVFAKKDETSESVFVNSLDKLKLLS